MAHITLVTGCIVGPTWKTDDFYRLHRLNMEALAKLPEYDKLFPYINRSMFSTPNEQGVFRNQLITFGASYKTLEYEWHLWLEKFEEILKTLFWLNVSIHVDFEVYGCHLYEWQTSPSKWKEYWIEKVEPVPVDGWIFKSDGPRKFDLY